MMTKVLLDGVALFGEGMCELHDRGIALRTAEQSPTAGDGVHLISQGRSGRTVTQTGVLLGDSVDDLDARVRAIEAAMDGLPRELREVDGRWWPEAMLTAFEPGKRQCVGVRWQLTYRATYRVSDSPTAG